MYLELIESVTAMSICNRVNYLLLVFQGLLIQKVFDILLFRAQLSLGMDLDKTQVFHIRAVCRDIRYIFL